MRLPLRYWWGVDWLRCEAFWRLLQCPRSTPIQCLYLYFEQHCHTPAFCRSSAEQWDNDVDTADQRRTPLCSDSRSAPLPGRGRCFPGAVLTSAVRCVMREGRQDLASKKDLGVLGTGPSGLGLKRAHACRTTCVLSSSHWGLEVAFVKNRLFCAESEQQRWILSDCWRDADLLQSRTESALVVSYALLGFCSVDSRKGDVLGRTVLSQGSRPDDAISLQVYCPFQFIIVCI